jgi:cell division protein FtsI/penicillin-binding protein 2
MAMAAVVDSVVEGSTVVPRLLPDQPTEANDVRRPLTAAEATTLRGLMRAVVTDGSGALLADVPGPPVIAKTGTAEFGDQEPLQTHAWMVAGQDDLAVAVFVDVGDSGSGTAGPLLERFLRAAR